MGYNCYRFRNNFYIGFFLKAVKLFRYIVPTINKLTIINFLNFYEKTPVTRVCCQSKQRQKTTTKKPNVNIMKKRNLLHLFHVHRVGNLKKLLAIPIMFAGFVIPNFAFATKKVVPEIHVLKADVQITGTVSDASGETLPGVSVSVKGGGRAVSTDANGRYTISVPENAVLVFNSIGYATKEV